MPPKRNARRGSASSGSDTSKDDASQAGALTKLAHKPCLCCGREISPRAKWARNWDSIKYCSDQCKGWRSVITVPEGAPLARDSSVLRHCLGQVGTPGNESAGNSPRLHIDAWLEASILQTARVRRPKSKQEHLPTLNDVGEALHAELAELESVEEGKASSLLNASGDSADCASSFLQAFLRDTKPGEREMLRRAARRLVILPHESLASTSRLQTTSSDDLRSLLDYRLQLSQRNGKTRVTSLHDVSHAKGDLEIQLRHAKDEL